MQWDGRMAEDNEDTVYFKLYLSTKDVSRVIAFLHHGNENKFPGSH